MHENSRLENLKLLNKTDIKLKRRIPNYFLGRATRKLKRPAQGCF
jgi:hypothetical protein